MIGEALKTNNSLTTLSLWGDEKEERENREEKEK